MNPHQENLRMRKVLEDDGYVFVQADFDGWYVKLDTVAVAIGKVPQGVKGEERTRYALDRAVFEAAKHRRNFFDALGKPPEPAEPVRTVVEVPGGTLEVTGLSADMLQMPGDPKKAHPAIQKAINFLVLVGAKYYIEHDGQQYGQLPAPVEPPKAARQSANSHYKPILDKQTAPFHLTIDIPEEFDPVKYTFALREYAYRVYGKENVVMQKRLDKVEIMVA